MFLFDAVRSGHVPERVGANYGAKMYSEIDDTCSLYSGVSVEDTCSLYSGVYVCVE